MGYIKKSKNTTLKTIGSINGYTKKEKSEIKEEKPKKRKRTTKKRVNKKTTDKKTTE